MRSVATRILASVLAGVLSVSCGTVREGRYPEDAEIVLIPRAPRAQLVLVEERELRAAIEDALPRVDADAVQAELRRLVADPRVHGRRSEGVRFVLANRG